MDKNFITRAITGTVYVALTLTATLSGPMVSALYFGIISIFCLFEFYRLSGLIKNQLTVPFISGIILLFAYLGFQVFSEEDQLFVWVMITIMAILVMMVFFLLNKDMDIKNWALSAAGWIYTMMPLVLLFNLANLTDEFNGKILLMIFVLVWSTDTFAYLTGRKWGKTKLAPSISPGKSVEGLAGGIIGSIGVACIFYYFNSNDPLWFHITSALIISVFGVLGDLFESKLKRQAGVKDSGNSLPGHGGFLDRFDSILMVAPAYFIFYYFYINFVCI